MNYIPSNHEMEGTSYPPSHEPTLNTWALLITGTVIILASTVAAIYASRLAVQHMDIDTAKIAVGQMILGGSIYAAVAGAGSTVLLAIAGQHRWAIAYACWLALGTGIVAGAVLIDFGSDMAHAMQESEANFSLTIIFPSIIYVLFLMIREGLLRPMIRIIKSIRID